MPAPDKVKTATKSKRCVILSTLSTDFRSEIKKIPHNSGEMHAVKPEILNIHTIYSLYNFILYI